MDHASLPVAGYQFIVNRGGNLYHSVAKGNSVYSPDPGGPISMTVETEINVASVSKFIGTIALMQVLEKHQISIESLVYDYLPESWKAAVHSDHYLFNSPYAFTFRNMLRMETGLAFEGSNWTPGIMPTTDQMMNALRKPAEPGRWGIYQNGNFTLIRVLIGELEYNLNTSDPNYNQNTTDSYFDYIKNNIFDKLNLDPPMSSDEVNDYYENTPFTRGHQFPFDITFRDASDNLGWPATSDPNLNGGSGGLVLSSLDLAKVLAYFMHDNSSTIISTHQRDIIITENNELGLTESSSGEHGLYLSKGGTRGPESGNLRALRSRIMIFPNGIEAVFLCNSNHNNLGGVLKSSYDDAWINPCD
jgi:CubicO group peptidase (beta-lactamase class C family)